MKALITIREYARLTTASVVLSLDEAQIPESAFDWLCEQSYLFNRTGAALLQVAGRRSLKWGSYVGVLETPCGTRIEILPKHIEQDDCVRKSRLLMRKLIQSALSIKAREISVTGLDLFDVPLTEWVMGQFLIELDYLVKRGVRFDYQRVDEEQRYLRGQLRTVAQMRQPQGRQHHFQIRHDVFLPDRAENRLLKLALERVCKATQNSCNWRLGHELRSRLSEIPASQNVKDDWRAWRKGRLIAHYESVRPWCELILKQQMPLAVAGEWQGISLLFPMEKLFERYVEMWFRRSLVNGANLVAQAASKHLCDHDGGKMFRLEPDILLHYGALSWVLDAKWKRVDVSDRPNKYGLTQSDFYQMYAYGQRYLKGQGELILIYPRRAQFERALPLFDFGNGLTLHALPFDLEGDCLIDADLCGLPVSKF